MSMELRMLLAVVLSFLVFFLYQVLFVKETPLQKKTPAEKPQRMQKETLAMDENVRALDERDEGLRQAQRDTIRPVPQGRTITVSTSLYVAEFMEDSGALKSFKLKKYKESLTPNAPMKELVQVPDEQIYTPVVSFLGKGLAESKHAVFQATCESEAIDASEAKKTLSFTWTSPEGVTLLKTYTFLPDTYEIDLEVKVRNLSPRPLEENLAISLKNSLKDAKNSRYVFSGPAALINGELKEIKIKKIANQPTQAGRIMWIAYEDQYFVSVIIPQKAEQASMRLGITPTEVLETTYIDPSGPLPPRMERTHHYRIYFGPKSLKALSSVGADLVKIVDFGFFDIIAKPLLHVMNFIHRYIPNYGIAIIFITIIVKLLFWPLSNKSYESMSQMKKLQPKMAEIRAKYKHDKKMMNQELMNLYRVYKVNPLGGCLPMILQIPVFFAFYKMLYQAIELRHAPFFWWINDLSAPDRLFHFNFKVPMMAPPYGIPVLTIIMGASMFFQQKMSPPPGDPTQAKMMMFMPIFFTVIFINFPSGLVLYWLVNNILSMVQQYYIAKKTG